MPAVSNFFINSRINTSSLIEHTADLLLTPARVLFGGRQAISLNNGPVVYRNQPDLFSTQSNWKKTAEKIVACILLPLSCLGALIKLLCLPDRTYREFCAQELSSTTTTHPRLFEMYEHVHNTAKFITHKSNANGSEETLFPALNLTECACRNSGAFDRLRNARRNNLENAIVDQLTTTHTDQTQPIRLLSMGSGGLLSDFITLEKLVLQGFKKIVIDCVDPEGIHPNRIQAIQNFFNGYLEGCVEIAGYNNINLLPSAHNNYNAVLAVDYDSLTSWDSEEAWCATANMMKARRLLAKTGFMALGFSRNDTLTGQTMNPRVLTPTTPFIERVITDFSKILPSVKELHIAIPTPSFASLASLFLYALAVAAESKAVTYEKLSVTCVNKNFFDTLKIPKFQEMLQTLFLNTSIEIIDTPVQDAKYDIYFTGSIERDFINKTHLTLLNNEGFSYVVSPNGGISRYNSQSANKPVRVL